MIRNISYIILSIAILIAGVVGFSKLSYSQRSARIFSYNAAMQPGGRPGEEGRGDFGRPGPSGQRFEGERRGQREMGRNIVDSLRQRPEGGGRERMTRGSIEGRPGGGEGRGRGDFQGGGEINLKNIPWFLAVFAAFTVIAIYCDRGVKLYRKKAR
jgi:hypothetical protein